MAAQCPAAAPRPAATTARATARARAASTSPARSARPRSCTGSTYNVVAARVRRRGRLRRGHDEIVRQVQLRHGRSGAAGPAARWTRDCVAPNICNASTCSLKPTGTACTMAGECNSGFCAQGYCCNSVHRDVQVVRADRQPRHLHERRRTEPRHAATQCAARRATTCGPDGMCNGSGACRFWAAGTQCAPGTCVGSTLTPRAPATAPASAGRSPARCAIPTSATRTDVQDDVHRHQPRTAWRRTAASA